MLSFVASLTPKENLRPCLVCSDPHDRPSSVFCSDFCKYLFLRQARARHALHRSALSVFSILMQG